MIKEVPSWQLTIYIHIKGPGKSIHTAFNTVSWLTSRLISHPPASSGHCQTQAWKALKLKLVLPRSQLSHTSHFLNTVKEKPLFS